MNQNEDVIDKLVTFGLTREEARVYTMLLGKIPQSILTISRMLSLPRTSVYDLTRSLMEKGLLERVIEYKRMKVRASEPSILNDIIQKDKDRIVKLEKNLEFLKTQLPYQFDQSPQTQVRYYHGIPGFRQMMWNILSAKDEIVGYSIFDQSYVIKSNVVQRWIEEMIKRKIHDRVIINTSKGSLTYLSNDGEKNIRSMYQQIRSIDEKKFSISGDTTIYNNVFAVAWWKQGEVVGVEIENPELVKTQKSIFEILWKLAKPLGMK